MSFEELEKLDREWEIERQRYMITTKHGRRYIPSSGAAVVVGLFSVSLGLMGIMLAFALLQNLGALASVLALFGIVFIIGGVAISSYQFKKAQRYQTAYRAYQRRRSTVHKLLKE